MIDLIFSFSFESQQLMLSRFLVAFEGPGGFKQLRETCRIDFHHSSRLADFMVPSYKENTVRPIFFEILRFRNSGLVEAIGHFCVQIPILFFEILPGDTSRGVETRH